MQKKVVISCGPIPARLDSVKFITNRFKGGLAFKTAAKLITSGYDVTVVTWKNTPYPDINGVRASEFWMQDNVSLVTVNDVFEYYEWYTENAVNYDAFIMAAAVANLTPSNPYEGKFPSHNYKVGEKFNIEFEIAPRAIDVVKQKNPRACLIGYKLFDAKTDEELIDIARHTLKDAKANIIFANTPATAKSEKIAVTADNSVIRCSFDEHMELIMRAIDQEYFRTVVQPMTSDEYPKFKQALAIVKMFDKTFPGFGTVAVPVAQDSAEFATTARGHSGEPVIVRWIDIANRIIYATGKATLNAPTLNACLEQTECKYIVVHRHDDDPLFRKGDHFDAEISKYLFPGTVEEMEDVYNAFEDIDVYRVKLCNHGDISCLPIQDVNWERYYELFPERYFGMPDLMEEIIESYRGKETLEVGCNALAYTKYAYDPYVSAENAINLTYEEYMSKHFDLVVARNSINYLDMDTIKSLLERTEYFIANTFRAAPSEKVSDREASVVLDGYVHHALRLPDDSIMPHTFHAYTVEDFEKLGFRVAQNYGKNSVLLYYKRNT